MDASRRFYVDRLGFEMTRRWIDDGRLRWCCLERGGAAVMLQEFRGEGHDSWAPERRVVVGVWICFICRDARALYRELVGRGLTPQRPCVANGMWMTYVEDPDGYRLWFESPTDDAEDSACIE